MNVSPAAFGNRALTETLLPPDEAGGSTICGVAQVFVPRLGKKAP